MNLFLFGAICYITWHYFSILMLLLLLFFKTKYWYSVLAYFIVNVYWSHSAVDLDQVTARSVVIHHGLSANTVSPQFLTSI